MNEADSAKSYLGANNSAFLDQLEQYLPELAVAVENPDVCPATCRRMLDSEDDVSDDEESESDDDSSDDEARLLKRDASGDYGWRNKADDADWYGNDQESRNKEEGESLKIREEKTRENGKPRNNTGDQTEQNQFNNLRDCTRAKRTGGNGKKRALKDTYQPHE